MRAKPCSLQDRESSPAIRRNGTAGSMRPDDFVSCKTYLSVPAHLHGYDRCERILCKRSYDHTKLSFQASLQRRSDLENTSLAACKGRTHALYQCKHKTPGPAYVYIHHGAPRMVHTYIYISYVPPPNPSSIHHARHHQQHHLELPIHHQPTRRNPITKAHIKPIYTHTNPKP